MTQSLPRSREWMTEMLALADEAELVELADQCLCDGVELTVIAAPEVGVVTAQVREPVCHDRFFLGEVLACRAEVSLAGARGWSMRLGDDVAATLAAAICDAEVAAGRPASARVLELCERIEQRRRVAAAIEWAQLEPTIVSFEEL